MRLRRVSRLGFLILSGIWIFFPRKLKPLRWME